MIEPIHDATFGRLVWDPLLDCWLGGIDWPPGLHTEVAIWPPGGGPCADLKAAHAALGWLHENEEWARRRVASAMLSAYNDAWRGEEPPITEDAFARRIELMRIGVESDGALLLSYDDHDLFAGHVIDGRFAPDRSFRDANLVG